MQKTSEKKIALDEKKVLDVLERHAKESIDEIAKNCGFSRQKVWRIIKNLEENKIIWGYTTITDKDANGLQHFVLLLKRTIVPLDKSMQKEVKFEKLDDHIPDLAKIESIYITHGRYDAIITFYAPDLITAKKTIDAISQRIGKYFKEYLLIETLFPIRKQGFKNPHIKNLVDYI